MCMLALESTDSLSSGFIADGRGKLHSLVGEKKVALSVSLSFKMFLASLHASPRAHRSSLSISSKFHIVRTALMKNFDLYLPSDGPLFSQMSA